MAEIAFHDDFVLQWVQAELEASGEIGELRARAAAEADELGEDEALADAAQALAERRGFLQRLRDAAAALGEGKVLVRESRDAERLERSGPHKLFFPQHEFRASLRATPGAAERLRKLAEALQAQPSATVAELEGTLGGSPGCSVR